MYLPIFRGRQYELLALRECAEKGLIGDKVLPVIEPVKATSTFITTVEAFVNNNKKVAVIRNPQVGSWDKNPTKSNVSKIHREAKSLFVNELIVPALYVTPELQVELNQLNSDGLSVDSSILICNDPENVNYYEETVAAKAPKYNLIPDRSSFRRRIRSNRVICEDHFPKQARNVDYINNVDELFSVDHLYFAEDGYIGFSDYSIVGEEYSETGFAPYAVAIHITYFDKDKALRIKHFVSDSNDDISDPAGKFGEAVKKLVKWSNEASFNTTVGLGELIEAYKDEKYPGLGSVKKYSIMHHLELMSDYLDEVAE